MLWTLQLSPWALAPLVAIVLLLRDALFLWPRRRERASSALLLLVAGSASWAALHLLAVVSPGLDAKVLLERGQLAVAATIPVAWAVFALVYAERPAELRRGPMVALYVVSAATVALVLHPDWVPLLIREVELVRLDSGLAGLSMEYGPWFWVMVAVRFAAVTAATAALTAWMVRSQGARKRSPVMAFAAVLALAPTAFHVAAQAGHQWTDPSPVGMALASAVLAWGLMRHRLLDLGPVARTLVMVELRDPIVVLDGRGRIVDANRAAETELGLHPYSDVPLPLGTLWAASRGKSMRSARLALDVGHPSGSTEERVFEVTLTPLGRREGTGRTALLLRDVTVRERAERDLKETSTALQGANEELERRANTDGLTGLANRRHFMEVLEHELERSERYGRPLSLLMLDLDHFKHVNDTHGHAAGDDVLRSAADALRSVCRDLDLPGRLGGEELSVLLPETGEEGARSVAERLRERIGQAVHQAPSGASFSVTASIGVAVAGTRSRTADVLLHRADEALYEAKQGGRNRVVVAA